MPESRHLCAAGEPWPAPEDDRQPDDTGQEREEVTPTVGGHPAIVAPSNRSMPQLAGHVGPGR